MAALNENSVVKRFHGVSATQDSIQSLSLWVIHHKAHHERIVELWFKVFKKAKLPHRLTLLYLCNDIVQTCKRKHAIIYKDAFKEILKDAALLVRDSSIRKNILRIFSIWEERKIYDGEFIGELKAALDQVQPAATLNSKLLAEFQPSTVVNKVRTYTAFTNEGELKRSQLNLGRMDALNMEFVKQLKDRQHGKEFSQQFEDACVKLEDYVGHVEKEVKEGQVVIELLEQGELFYDAQYGEAKIVANAYKNFGTRVSNLKRKLEEHMKNLPSPVPSPSPEAPSPGNTPPMLRETIDNNEAVDMDLSDDDEVAGSQNESRRRESTITTGSYMKPITSITTILMKQNKPYDVSGNASPKSIDSLPSPKGSPIGMSPTRPGIPAYASFLNNAGASFLPNSKDFSLSDSPKPIPTLGSDQKGALEEFLAGGDSTPLRDEHVEEEGRAGTPVMDEALEGSQQSPPDVPDSIPLPPAGRPSISMAPHMMPPRPVPHPQQAPPPPMPSNDEAADNPMEFLTQLIIHHQAQKKGNKDSKNDFLQSLSDMAKPAKSSSETSKTDSWPWTDQKEQHNSVSPSTPMSAPSLPHPPTPPTSVGHMHLPVPPPPPPNMPNMPLPPRPPMTPTSFPFSQNMPTPPVQSSPRTPGPMMSGPPQPSPFPGPPPHRPGFNNGINQWSAPPPPPPPVSSASGNNNFNNQNPQGFGPDNSDFKQNSQGYDRSNMNSGYDSRNYDSQEFGGGKPPLDGHDDKFGPRGSGMSPFTRPNHNNLMTVHTQDFSGGELNSPRGPMPRPLRPPFPPGMGMRGPRPMLHMPNNQSPQDDNDEFISKLRHKSASSPPVQGGPHRRTLTEILTRGKGDDSMDPQDNYYSDDEHGAPIATLSGLHPQHMRRLSSDNGRPMDIPSPMGHKLGGMRPRMPPPSPEGHFRPRFDSRDSRDSYAPREPYHEHHEPFHRDFYQGEGGFGRSPKRMPPPMRGGFYPRF